MHACVRICRRACIHLAVARVVGVIPRDEHKAALGTGNAMAGYSCCSKDCKGRCRCQRQLYRAWCSGACGEKKGDVIRIIRWRVLQKCNANTPCPPLLGTNSHGHGRCLHLCVKRICSVPGSPRCRLLQCVCSFGLSQQPYLPGRSRRLTARSAIGATVFQLIIAGRFPQCHCNCSRFGDTAQCA